jgi:uncharacterized membrane protein
MQVQTLVPLGQRVRSLDVVRGVVMVLMAIDHVRVYAGVPAGGPTPGVFFTRWVTHFCAPAFVFLAGTAAYLHLKKLGDRAALAKYLVSRGLLLILLEFTIIRASWTFTLDYSEFLLAGVIWMLGCCMVVLAAFVWLPTRLVAALGIGIIVFQDAFGSIGRALPQSWHSWWELVYPVGASLRLGTDGPSVAVLYTLVPWVGVMAAGYAFGALVSREESVRDRWCLRLGLAATALFVVFAAFQVVFSTPGPDAPPAWLRFLNQRKYPASVLFLLMTLGPAIALMPAAGRARGWIADAFAIFGRVPMLYYLLHIPLIHIVVLAVRLVQDGAVHPEWYATAPYTAVPRDFRWGLLQLHVVFAAVVALLYLPCRWFAGMKARTRARWMSYV